MKWVIASVLFIWAALALWVFVSTSEADEECVNKGGVLVMGVFQRHQCVYPVLPDKVPTIHITGRLQT